MKADDFASTPSDPTWPELKPLLDDAMQELADDDRHAVVLRYFDGQDFASVGRVPGLTADAARRRVARGLERLRSVLKRRGVSSSVVALEALWLQESVEAFSASLPLSIARTVRTVSTAAASVPALAGGTKALVVGALLLLITAVGTAILRGPWFTQRLSGASDWPHPAAGSRNAIRFLQGRPRVWPQGAPIDPKVADAIGFLRSALFDIQLGPVERNRLLEQSAGMLVGMEGESIALFREALTASRPAVVSMAIEGIGRFGQLPREFGPELMALLQNPAFHDDAGLIANRLLPSMLVANSPVPVLLSLLERRPDLSSPLQYLLSAAIGSDKSQLAAHRQAVEALLNNPNTEIQAVAQAILADLPEPSPLPTRVQ